MKLGLISDTHGLLRDSALAAMRGCDLIVHAGDVGRAEVLEALQQAGPLVAIRGNVDTGEWAASLPETADAQIGDARIYLIHNVKDLTFDPAGHGYNIVVSGHSHKAASSVRHGVLYLNPGAAGPRRFHLPVTVAILDLEIRPWEMRVLGIE